LYRNNNALKAWFWVEAATLSTDARWLKNASTSVIPFLESFDMMNEKRK
jgi:hypothetical protein